MGLLDLNFLSLVWATGTRDGDRRDVSISLQLKYLQVIVDKQYGSAIIGSLRWHAFPAPRPMATRQVVLLTPLESPHPQRSPSSHRINLMNTDFPVVHPLYFQTLTGVHFATPLLPISYRNGGGCTTLPPAPSAELTFRRIDIWTLRRSVSSLPATFTTPRKCCIQKTYVSAKPLSCNIYRKPGGGISTRNSKSGTSTTRCLTDHTRHAND